MSMETHTDNQIVYYLILMLHRLNFKWKVNYMVWDYVKRRRKDII